jgi:hypothetical protein
MNQDIRSGASPVMLNAAKHLSAQRARPFAEFTLSVANVLRVTVEGPIKHFNTYRGIIAPIADSSAPGG